MMRCKCGRLISRHLHGECLACRYMKRMYIKSYEERICACCGEPFIPSKHSHDQKYCSYKCMYTAANMRRLQRLGRTPTIKACAVCGKEFQSTSTGMKKYCSEGCYLKAARQRAKELHKTFETRHCLRCGAEFQASMYSGRQYCSDKCRFPSKRGAYQHIEKRRQKKPLQAEPIMRGQYMKGIIPETHGWNSPIPTKDDKPVPRVRLKCDPSKLPIPLLPPTRQYTGIDPDAEAKEDRKWNFTF